MISEHSGSWKKIQASFSALESAGMTSGMSSSLAMAALRLDMVEEQELLGVDTKEFRKREVAAVEWRRGKRKEGTHGCGVPENFTSGRLP
jgi:hypothetical protein